MANNDAVIMAEKLNDIKFPEFTAKLVTDTFDAIIAANIRQTESYIALVGALSKSLSDYINDTKDDISGAEVLEFLTSKFPPSTADSATRIAVGNTLSSTELTDLKDAVTVSGQPPPALPPNATAGTPGVLVAKDLTDIAAVVAQRLAANKYTLLHEMVKMGLLRLVVTDGKIISQLTFSTWSYSFYTKNSATYNTNNFGVTANAKTGSLLSRWFSASAATKYTSVSVRTTNETQQDNSGSSVNIFGRVEINFKTDYQPLT
jgi:hypothetical protein